MKMLLVALLVVVSSTSALGGSDIDRASVNEIQAINRSASSQAYLVRTDKRNYTPLQFVQYSNNYLHCCRWGRCWCHKGMGAWGTWCRWCTRSWGRDPCGEWFCN